MKIEVFLESDDEKSATISFTVKDSGIGIEKDQQAHVFDRFTQAEKATTRKYGGTGLGLAISKKLVELQGGKMQLSSEPGKGSEFSFNLTFEKGKSGESYNISANNEIDNLTVIKKILEIMNKSEDLIEFVEDRPGHDLRYSMDSNKIMKNLDWKIYSDFDNGLKTTIDWYLQNPSVLNDITKALETTPWKNSN